MEYYLGIDVSTTATKALLMDSTGQVIAVHSTSYGFETPHPLWSEQSPALWWDGAQRSIRAALDKAGISGEAVAAVGLTGQMHGLVLLDAEGNVLRPAILWNDGRTQSQCDEIHQRIGYEKFIQITGNVALAGFTAPKILWVRENEPQVYNRAAHVLLPKDYVRYKLTGEFAMDKADGAGTVLMDLEQRDWSEEVLTGLEIPRSWMPPLYEGPNITGQITPTAAQATGLKPGTPVMAGGGDQAAQAVGVGAVEPGIVSLTLGTSGVVFATTPSALIEPQGRLHAFCHAVPGRWHFMGVMLSAAGSLQWYRDTLAPGMAFDDLLKEAVDIPPGSEGLLFLPYQAFNIPLRIWPSGYRLLPGFSWGYILAAALIIPAMVDFFFWNHEITSFEILVASFDDSSSIARSKFDGSFPIDKFDHIAASRCAVIFQQSS